MLSPNVLNHAVNVTVVPLCTRIQTRIQPPKYKRAYKLKRTFDCPYTTVTLKRPLRFRTEKPYMKYYCLTTSSVNVRGLNLVTVILERSSNFRT